MASHSHFTPEFNKSSDFFAPEHLPRSAIHTEKWDACVRKSVNETPLAYSWVLDHLNPGWEGVIFGDYEGVMPLPVSYRLGMKMIQMPPEVLTLGIISDNPEITRQFPRILKHPLFSSFRFIAYNGSPMQEDFSGYSKTITKQTQELKLDKNYAQLYRGYSESHQRNIRLFQKINGSIHSEDSPETFIHLIAEMGGKRPELFIPRHYRRRFQTMMQDALNSSQGILLSSYDNHKPAGSAFFLNGDKRTVLFHIANEEGRKTKTSFGLINQFIREYAGSSQILDFSGSVIPNVAEFNRRFGAKPVPYPSVTINRLPFVMRAAKEMKLLFRIRHLFGG
ncbi:MAG: hypothetical protein ACQEQ0_11785 [Bacteroidota bacterium]